MTDLSEEGQDRLKNPQKKQILMELTLKVPLKDIADQYGTDERTIQRVRQWALKNRGLRSSLDKKVQAYLTDWEKRPRSKKAAPSTKVASANNTDKVTVTDKNIEEKFPKVKINSRRLDDHYKVLSTTAVGMADLLYIFKDCNGERTLGQLLDPDTGIPIEQYDPDQQLEPDEQDEILLKLLLSTEAEWLLSHIKSEAPNLFIHFMYAHPEFFTSEIQKKPQSEHIDGWDDMTEDDCLAYGKMLIKLLKTRAAQKEFPGTCEVCKGWK